MPLSKLIGMLFLFCLPLLYFVFEKERPRSPCNGNHFSSWAGEASPALGCSIEISRDWASEASPTLGCSIEISHIIIGVCLSYVKLTA